MSGAVSYKRIEAEGGDTLPVKHTPTPAPNNPGTQGIRMALSRHWILHTSHKN